MRILDDVTYVPDYNEALCDDTEIIPERMLYLAIIHRAIADMRNPQYTDSRYERKTAQAQAKDWPKTASFKYVCSLAGINPDYLKERLR